MAASKVPLIRTWLNENNINIRNDWLEECVEYFSSQNNNISFEDLKNQTYQQWLLNDIADTSLGCLPEINRNTKQLLGQFVLQLQTIIDVSVPAFNQLEQIFNLPVEKLEEEFEQEKSTRVLKLELTDGRNFVKAMEYRSIKCLSLNLKPGSKIVLKGPINVSFNGILYLEDKNILVLGGEVDFLLETNSVINILLKSLNISPTDNIFRNLKNNILSTKIGLQTTNVNNISPHKETSNILVDDINAFIEDIDFENISIPSTSKLVDSNMQLHLAEKPAKKNILDPSYPIRFNKNPLIYIKQVDEVQSNIIKSKNFVLIVKIKEFIEKLCIRDGVWQNLVSVDDYLVDDTELKLSLNVKLHSDLITKCTGFDVPRMAVLKTQLTEVPEIVGDLLKSFQKMKDNFMKKVYLAEMQIFPSIANEPPVIFNLEEFSDKYKELAISKKNYD